MTEHAFTVVSGTKKLSTPYKEWESNLQVNKCYGESFEHCSGCLLANGNFGPIGQDNLMLGSSNEVLLK